ncbi:hypothetical protein WA171_002991 [Blastocystis sp. BT1]
MSSFDIDSCNDIEVLKAYTRTLEKEYRHLKDSYIVLSSRMSKVMPILKEELPGCNWDFTAQDSQKALDKSIESAIKDSIFRFMVTSVEIGQDRGCLKLLDTMHIPRTSIYCCSFNSSGKFLACGCFNGSIVIYKYSTSRNRIRHIRSITGHAGLVTSVMWIKGDDRIVTTSIDKTIRVWKPMTGEFETLIKTDMMVMSACLFGVGDRDVCAAVGSQNRILFADIGDSKVIRLLEHKYQIKSIVEYKQYVVIGDCGGNVMVINNSTYDCINQISRPKYEIQNMTIHRSVNDEYYLAVMYSNNIIEVFLMDGVDLVELSTYQIPELKTVHATCTIIEDPSLSLVSVVSQEENIEDIEEKIIPHLYIIAGGMTGQTYLWPVYRHNVFQKPRVMKTHDDSIYCIDYSVSSKMLATCSQDHSLILWKGV